MLLAVLIIVILGFSWFAWINLKNKEPSNCGNVILEGYLVRDCPWSAYPWLENVNSSQASKCFLDVWLSNNKPEGQVSDACSNQPLTSFCFLKQLTAPPEDSKVILIGNYENLEVCHLLRKCTEPECYECNVTKVFVPCDVIGK